MANNKLASAATTKAATPDELYDTLNETQQAVWDLIGSMGFRPDRDEELKWWALARVGDDKIGPKPTLSDLAEAVQKFVSEKEAAGSNGNGSAPKAEKLKVNPGNKKQYLDGMEPVVDPEIAAAAGKYHALKTERVALLKEELVAKDELAELCHNKPELFKADPDNTKEKIYKIGDLLIRMANEIKEKITTEIVESED